MKIRRVFESVGFYQKIKSWHDKRTDLRVIDEVERLNLIKEFTDLEKAKVSKSKLKYRNSIEKTQLDILSDNDEWYYVRVIKTSSGSTEKQSQFIEYYKCDQWSGLLELIKDKVIWTISQIERRFK